MPICLKYWIKGSFALIMPKTRAGTEITMTFTYAVFAVPFICAGLYFYGMKNSRQRPLYVVMFGIAAAINYFAAFAMLALIVADNAVTSASADSPILYGYLSDYHCAGC